jgi:hypothetical protein
MVMWPAAATAQGPAKTVAQYTTGEIRFTQGGQSYTAALTAGRIEVTEQLAGEAPIDVRTLSLSFAFLGGGVPGAQPDITIVLTNADSAGTYGASDIVLFVVRTSRGGASVFRSDRGDCTFELTRLERAGVNGTAQCRGEMAGVGEGPGQLVTDVAFNARP